MAAFLALLHAAGLPERDTGPAFFLIYDYTLGFALGGRTSVNEQRVHDAATRRQLHAFLRSLPAERFPTLVTHGKDVWVDNRDDRFAAGLDTLVHGLEAARRGRRQPVGTATVAVSTASATITGLSEAGDRLGEDCEAIAGWMDDGGADRAVPARRTN